MLSEVPENNPPPIKSEVPNDLSFDTSHNQIYLQKGITTMITFGRKLKHLRQKNHLTQEELGIALGFPEDSADVRIAQYEADARKPRDETLVEMAKMLCVPVDIFTVPVLSEPKEYEAASFWMHELAAEL